MIIQHHFRFGHLDFYPEYAVITCNEDEDIGFREITEIQAILYPQYDGKRFGLIANREHHYAVDPLAINELFSQENLIAGAIVSQDRLASHNAKVEDMFVDGAPIRFFPEMGLAVDWIKSLRT